jgi:hypothetical protein
LDAGERAAFQDEIAHRTSPTFDFFLFSLASGAVIGAGLLLDAPILLMLGAVLAPMMSPAVGISLGTVTGSLRCFGRSLLGLLIGGLLAGLAGAAVGMVTAFWAPPQITQAYYYSQLTWPNFLVLAVGACLTAAAMLQESERSPALSSVVLAYTLYLPITVAGFGLTSGAPDLWPDGLVVFAIHLAWSALLGALVLAILGFRPLTLYGYTLGSVMALMGILLLIGLSGAGVAVTGQVAIPTLPPPPTPTITPTATQTPTPMPPTGTPTRTPTSTPITPTLTPTPSPTLTPTPVFAVVRTADGKGVVLRAGPGGDVLSPYFDGTLMQVLLGAETVNGVVWLHVRAPDGTEGWMVSTLLVTVTPAPN